MQYFVVLPPLAGMFCSFLLQLDIQSLFLCLIIYNSMLFGKVHINTLDHFGHWDQLVLLMTSIFNINISVLSKNVVSNYFSTKRPKRCSNFNTRKELMVDAQIIFHNYYLSIF